MLVKWGSIIVKGSGKLGGHVYSGGRSGASVHTSARARNPQTIYQTEVRSRFTQFTQSWRDLTESQRETWYDAESSFSRTNRFGDVVTLSGKNLYESLNTERAVIGLNAIDIAPMPKLIQKNILTKVEIYKSIPNIAIFGEYQPSAVYVVVGSKAVSQGVKNAKGDLKIISVNNANGSGTLLTGALGIYNSYVERFGIPMEGEKIFIGTYSINVSGQRSPVASVVASFKIP